MSERTLPERFPNESVYDYEDRLVAAWCEYPPCLKRTMNGWVWAMPCCRERGHDGECEFDYRSVECAEGWLTSPTEPGWWWRCNEHPPAGLWCELVEFENGLPFAVRLTGKTPIDQRGFGGDLWQKASVPKPYRPPDMTAAEKRVFGEDYGL